MTGLLVLPTRMAPAAPSARRTHSTQSGDEVLQRADAAEGGRPAGLEVEQVLDRGRHAVQRAERRARLHRSAAARPRSSKREDEGVEARIARSMRAIRRPDLDRRELARRIEREIGRPLSSEMAAQQAATPPGGGAVMTALLAASNRPACADAPSSEWSAARGRRTGAWWPSRSSKPVKPRISAWRVRFPSASATCALVVSRPTARRCFRGASGTPKCPVDNGSRGRLGCRWSRLGWVHGGDQLRGGLGGGGCGCAGAAPGC